MSPIPNQPALPKKSQFEVGYITTPRFWVFDDDYLYGSSFRTRWPLTIPIQAEVEWKGRHGVYGWKELLPLCEWLREHQTEPVVVGAVRLWGHVIEHETGWRAQYGRVHALFHKVINGKVVADDDHIRRLRRNYGLEGE